MVLDFTLINDSVEEFEPEALTATLDWAVEMHYTVQMYLYLICLVGYRSLRVPEASMNNYLQVVSLGPYFCCLLRAIWWNDKLVVD